GPSCVVVPGQTGCPWQLVCRDVEIDRLFLLALLDRTAPADRDSARAGEGSTRLHPKFGKRQPAPFRLVLDGCAAMLGIIIGGRRRLVVELALGAGPIGLAEGPTAADVDAGRCPAGPVPGIVRPH